MRKLALLAAVAFATVGYSTGASATQPTTCDNSTALAIFSPAAINCVGYYRGNILDNSGGNTNPPTGDVATQIAALGQLDPSFTFTSFNNYPKLSNLNPLTTTGLTFLDSSNNPITLFGTVLIGVHWGNVPDSTVNPNNNGRTGNVTGFFEFNLTSPITTISLNDSQGISDSVLYLTNSPPGGVPEPATWAMMIAGFGATGFALRRSRRRKALLTQLA